MKTKIQSRLAVFLFVVAGIFICESVQAYFSELQPWAGNQGPSGGGGGGGGGYHGPSAAEIAAQQAAAEQQRREAAAYAENEQGLDAYKKKDWATAEAYFKQSLQNNPNDSVVLRNLAQTQNWEGNDAYQKWDYTTALKFYQQALANDPPTDKDRHYITEDVAAAQKEVDDANAEVEREKQQQIQDKASANDMKDSLSRMVNSLSTENNASTAGSKTPDTTSAESAGLTFTDTDPSLNNAVADNQPGQQQQQQQQQPSSGQKGIDLSGVPIGKDGLPTDQKTVTPGKNNAQQALDALKTVGAPEGGGKQQVIDTLGPQGKDLTPADLSTPASSSEIPDIPKGMEGDDVIQKGVTRLKTWLSQSQQDKADVIKKQAAF